MAERKLRFDAATSAAIPHPRIRMPEPGGSDKLAESGPSVLAASSNKTTPHDASGGRPPKHGSEITVDDQPSELESAIRQKLISHPSVKFSSLVVRQIDGGICLEGTVETSDGKPDIERLVHSVAHVDQVLNRLVTRPSDASAE